MTSCLVLVVGLFLFLILTTVSVYSQLAENYEVQALMDVKDSLVDPNGVLKDWDRYSVDPCSWIVVTCSPDNLVTELGTPSRNLSGILSPSIGNLTNLQRLLLENNQISGPIPQEIGKLSKLQTLDLSNNFFNGQLPTSLGHLKSLRGYLRLNHNNLSGEFPLSLANLSQLAFLDLSYNNLSGPVLKFPATAFNYVGNPLICARGSENECYGTTRMPLSFNYSSAQPSGRPGSHKMEIALGISLGCLCIIGFGMLIVRVFNVSRIIVMQT